MRMADPPRILGGRRVLIPAIGLTLVLAPPMLSAQTRIGSWERILADTVPDSTSTPPLEPACLGTLAPRDSLHLVGGTEGPFRISVRVWGRDRETGAWRFARVPGPMATDTLPLRIVGVTCRGRGLTIVGEYRGRFVAVEDREMKGLGEAPFVGGPWVHIRSAAGPLVLAGLTRHCRAPAGPGITTSRLRIDSPPDVCTWRLVDFRAAIDSTLAAARAAERRAEQDAAATRRRAQEARAERIRALGWPARFTADVIARKVAIGMTDAMVREAWGNPDRVSRRLTAAGRMEIWYYGDTQSVTLDDGVVVIIDTYR
jgi:hypothetical protein